MEPPGEGVEIRVVSTAVHADVIVPLVTVDFNWLEHFPHELFQGDVRFATHVAVGWGDRGFYLETPTWAELKLSTALRALLWPTASCFHVTMTRADQWLGKGRLIRISPARYRELVEYILSGLIRDAQGRVTVVPGIAHGDSDIFLEARGRYHCLNTCNSWVGRAMRRAGIRVPWFTPLPKSMFLWLPKDSEG
jgi:uncharacterized protein (TIGR02117 family)